VLLELIEHGNPPVHLLLGNDALSVVRSRLAALNREIDEWENVSKLTDFS
jgi:hypothetical protein